MNRTAILIDGGFFVKRAIRLWGKKTPAELAMLLQDYCNRHLKRNRDDYHQLYRIFYYDCPPINKKLHHPLSNRLIDFSKTDQYEWRLAFHDELRKLRKMALRLGYLDEEGTSWNLNPALLRPLISGKLPINKLREEDIILNTKQKGVDMKIGVDIASMSYKRQVQQMILIAGDSDFVPAAKLARREGIDFILDPMWARIKPYLFEHIDGLRTVCESPHAAGEDPFVDAGSKAEMGYLETESTDYSAPEYPDNALSIPGPKPVKTPPKKPAAKSRSSSSRSSRSSSTKSTSSRTSSQNKKPAETKPAETKPEEKKPAEKPAPKSRTQRRRSPASSSGGSGSNQKKTETKPKETGAASATAVDTSGTDRSPAPRRRRPTRRKTVEIGSRTGPSASDS